MKQNLFSFLLWNNPKSSANSEEQIFFDSHAYLFNEKTNIFNLSGTLFGLIQACIVLRSTYNKEELDRLPLTLTKDIVSIPQLKEAAFQKLTYASIDDKRIYIPTYSKELNDIYFHHLEDLIDGQYKDVLKDPKLYIVNPFEEYGNAIYNSPFTRLIKLKSANGVDTFYHIGFETLFVVDSTGSLIDEIPLFDEKNKNGSKDNLFERLDVLMDAYYRHDKDEFIQRLVSLELISQSLYKDILHFEEKKALSLQKRGVL